MKNAIHIRKVGLAMFLTICAGATFWFNVLQSDPAEKLEQQAEDYVVLALGIDLIHEGEVDAYFGPVRLQEKAVTANRNLGQILSDASALLAKVTAPTTESSRANATAAEQIPVALQDRQQALAEKIRQLMKLTDFLTSDSRPFFADELDQLYSMRLPDSIPSFEDKLKELERLLPGKGTTAFKLAAFQNKLLIPAGKRQAVFEAALSACRERTLTHWELPADERLSLEWSRDVQAAWHRYQGNHHSTLKLNGLSIALISNAIELACHEGYPGHHAQFILMDKPERPSLKVEDTIVLLRSPASVLREGAANYAIELAFPPDERLVFERDVLFPLAGLPPEQAEHNHHIHQLVTDLAMAAIPIIQEYYDGDINFNAASFRLEREAMISSPIPLLKYIDQYGTYAMGYTLAQERIKQYIDRHADHDQESRWELLASLLTRSKPSALAELQNE